MRKLLIAVLISAVGVALFTLGNIGNGKSGTPTRPEAEPSSQGVAEQHVNAVLQPAPQASREVAPASEVNIVMVPSRKQGTITGQLLDGQSGHAIPQGSVELLDKKGHVVPEGRRTSQVDPQGEFEFSRLAPGSYRLGVTGLPVEYLAPRQATGINVPEDGGVNVELRVFLRSVVQGYVLGPAGEPMDDVLVRLQCITPGKENLCADAETDETGFFEMVSVHPEWYQTQIYHLKKESPFAALSRPLPIEIVVGAGSVTTLPPLLLGQGSCSVSGTVVDQEGKPFPGLPVLCYLNSEVTPGRKPHNWSSVVAWTTTQENGSYSFRGLPSVKIGIQIAPYAFDPSREDNLLGRFAEPIYLDLSRDPHATAPKNTVQRSMPFRLKGSIVLDPGWAKRKEVTLKRLRVTLAVRGNDQFVPVKIKLTESGEFSWRCETPHEPLTLTVSVKGASIPLSVHDVFPLPNDKQQMTIRVP